jgi:hypothetical protein
MHGWPVFIPQVVTRLPYHKPRVSCDLTPAVPTGVCSSNGRDSRNPLRLATRDLHALPSAAIGLSVFWMATTAHASSGFRRRTHGPTCESAAASAQTAADRVHSASCGHRASRVPSKGEPMYYVMHQTALSLVNCDKRLRKPPLRQPKADEGSTSIGVS